MNQELIWPFVYFSRMRILAKHKRAHLDYDIQQTYDAGIVLQWHEVKACKMDHCNITDALIRFDEKTRQLMVVNMDIPLYSKTQHSLVPWYIPKHPRVLLLKIREITKIVASTKKTGLMIVPIQLYEAGNRRIKLQFWLGKTRRNIEKKQILKEKDQERQMRKEIKEY